MMLARIVPTDSLGTPAAADYSACQTYNTIDLADSRSGVSEAKLINRESSLIFYCCLQFVTYHLLEEFPSNIHQAVWLVRGRPLRRIFF